MTVTLTYDPVLSRVQVTGGGMGAATSATVERSTDQILWALVRGGVDAPVNVRPDVRATFSTVASNGWPAADTGQAWSLDGNPASDYSGNGTVGLHTHTAVNALHHTHIDTGTTEHQVQVEVTVPVVPTGAAITVRAAGRFVDTNNYYEAQILINTSGTTAFTLRKRVASVGSQVGSATVTLANHAAGNTWVITLLCSGTSLLTKARRTIDPETDWLITETDTSLTTGTRVACLSRLESGNTNTLPVAISWDNTIAGPRVVQVDDYEFSSGVPNFYRVTPTPAGLWLLAVSGDNASTPDTAVLDITGDLDLRADATVEAWQTGIVSGETDYFITKYNTVGNLRAYSLRLSTTGQLQLLWSNDGTTALTRTATVMPTPDPDTGRLAVRATLDVDNGASGHTVVFYTAPTMDGPWTQLGAPVVTASTTSIFNSSAALIAGAIDAGAAGLMPAVIHAAEVRNGINGTVVANPDFAAQPDGTTSFADAAGRTWTVNGNAVIEGWQTATITPVLDSIWLKSVTRPFLNRKVTVVDWSPEERPSRSMGFPVVGRTYEVAVTDVAGGLVFDLDLHVSNREDAQTLDYIRASGDILFLHTPLGCEVPGGHVCVDTSSARRPRPRGSSRVFTLPLRQCAAPGPDVVGATSTWQTVLNSYASWSAVLAANPTWADLLARVAPPSEVIVP